MRKYCVTYRGADFRILASMIVECATVGMAMSDASDRLEAFDHGYKILCDARHVTIDEVVQ